MLTEAVVLSPSLLTSQLLSLASYDSTSKLASCAQELVSGSALEELMLRVLESSHR